MASFQVKPGMIIEVKEKSRTISHIDDSLKTVSRRGIPHWLEVEVDNFRGVMKELPSREDLPPTIREQLIVEYYSR